MATLMTTTASLLDRSVLPRGSSKLDRSRADWRLRLRFFFRGCWSKSDITTKQRFAQKTLPHSLSRLCGDGFGQSRRRPHDTRLTDRTLTEKKLHFKLFLRSLAHYFLPNSGVASSPPHWLMLHFSEIHTERKWTVDSTGDGWRTDWTTL